MAYSASNYIEGRIHKGEGLKLWYSKGQGSGGMFNINARTGVSVGVDEFIDNAIMPGIGPSPSSKIVKGLELGATIANPLGDLFGGTNSTGTSTINGNYSNRSKKVSFKLFRFRINIPQARNYSIWKKDTAIYEKDTLKFLKINKQKHRTIDSLIELN